MQNQQNQRVDFSTTYEMLQAKLALGQCHQCGGLGPCTLEGPFTTDLSGHGTAANANTNDETGGPHTFEGQFWNKDSGMLPLHLRAYQL